MALKLGNILIGFVLFSCLTSLYSTLFDSMIDTYNLEDSYTEDNLNIMDQLKGVVLIQGVQRIVESILSIVNPSSGFDIIGGFLSVGIGIFQIMTGIIVFPAEIVKIILTFYPIIPPIVGQTISLIFTILIAMMLLNKTTGGND